MAHGLDFILESIKGLEVKHPELLFLFVGDGAEKENLIRQADELKLEQCPFPGFCAEIGGTQLFEFNGCCPG